MVHTRIFKFNILETNCMVLWADGSASCVVVDPGLSSPDELVQLMGLFADEKLTPEAILLTHGHFDHVWGVEKLLERYDIPVYLHPEDRPLLKMGSGLRGLEHALCHDFPSRDIAGGDVLHLAGIHFHVLHTPGHSLGGVCYWIEEEHLLLSGDTLFAGSIGRSDLQGGDYDQLMHSINTKLLTLPGDTDVLPGHGQPTSIVREATTNPFLEPFNQPEGDTPRSGIAIQPL